jgi:ELWxxDGT repeat protein
MNRITFYLLFFAIPTFGQTPQLVVDLYPGFLSGVFSSGRSALAGNYLYFTAFTSGGNEELWKTDGTAAGTVLVKDINPGSGTSFPKIKTVFKDQVYFTAQEPVTDLELWRTDDVEGAILAAGDPCPNNCSGAFYGTEERLFAEHNGKLYFRLSSAAGGYETWVSDGTVPGTAMFKNIKPGSGDSNPYGFLSFKGNLYFAADTTSEVGTELWVSDGTAAGTRMLKNINTDSYGSSEMGSPVAGDSLFYFWAKKSFSDGPEFLRS